MVYNTQHERGDTLIEVLVSIVILGVVIVGVSTIMSRGLSSAQLAIEHSQVRQQVNGQLDMLEYLRDQYIRDKSPTSAWLSIVAASNTTTTTYGASCTPSKPGFYLQEAGSGIAMTPFNPAAQPTTSAVPGQGLWIEATRSVPAHRPAYVDFVIRACWPGVNSAPPQQAVSAVRLYDPSR